MNVHEKPANEAERIELLTLIRDQAYETMNVDAHITCPGCKRKVPMRSAYHCFFCGLWFCRHCSGLHFRAGGKV